MNNTTWLWIFCALASIGAGQVLDWFSHLGSLPESNMWGLPWVGQVLTRGKTSSQAIFEFGKRNLSFGLCSPEVPSSRTKFILGKAPQSGLILAWVSFDRAGINLKLAPAQKHLIDRVLCCCVYNIRAAVTALATLPPSSPSSSRHHHLFYCPFRQSSSPRAKHVRLYIILFILISSYSFWQYHQIIFL